MSALVWDAQPGVRGLRLGRSASRAAARGCWPMAAMRPFRERPFFLARHAQAMVKEGLARMTFSGEARPAAGFSACALAAATGPSRVFLFSRSHFRLAKALPAKKTRAQARARRRGAVGWGLDAGPGRMKFSASAPRLLRRRPERSRAADLSTRGQEETNGEADRRHHLARAQGPRRTQMRGKGASQGRRPGIEHGAGDANAAPDPPAEHVSRAAAQ